MSRCVRLLIVALWLTSSLFPQDRKELEKRLKMQLEGKDVVVRNFYDDNRLQYDQSGLIKGDVKSGPWTLLGYVRIDGVHLKGETLNIDGERVFVRFDGDVGKRKPHEVKSGRRVEIEIDVPKDEPEDKVSAALQGAFLSASEQLTDIAPAYWQSFLRGVKPAVPGETLNGAEVKKVGGRVHPPKLRFSPDPAYNEIARRARFEGKVVLSGVIDADGWMKQLQITSPVGFGLDEKGIAAAQTWRFNPATQDGKPVPVRISIEINFHLY